MLRALFYICIFLLSLAQFSKVGSEIYLFDIFVAIFSVTCSIYFLIIKKFKLSKYLVLFFVFTIFAFITLIINAHFLSQAELLEAAAYGLRFLVYLLFANGVYNLIENKLLSKEQFLRSLLVSALFISIVGFVQLVFLPDFTVLDEDLGWDPHKNRLASTFFDPNFVGGYLVLVLTITLMGFSKEKIKKNLFWFFIILLAVFFTYSRSTWGMGALIILIYGLLKNPKIILLSLFIGFLAYFAIPRIQTRFSGITDPSDSASLRLISWDNALTIAKDNLRMGVGFNAYKKSQIEYGFLTPDTLSQHHATGADSSFLLVLATTGLLGLFLFLSGYFLPILSSKSLIVKLVLIGLLLQSQFINALFYPQILFLWLTLIAIN